MTCLSTRTTWHRHHLQKYHSSSRCPVPRERTVERAQCRPSRSSATTPRPNRATTASFVHLDRLLRRAADHVLLDTTAQCPSKMALLQFLPLLALPIGLLSFPWPFHALQAATVPGLPTSNLYHANLGLIRRRRLGAPAHCAALERSVPTLDFPSHSRALQVSFVMRSVSRLLRGSVQRVFTAKRARPRAIRIIPPSRVPSCAVQASTVTAVWPTTAPRLGLQRKRTASTLRRFALKGTIAMLDRLDQMAAAHVQKVATARRAHPSPFWFPSARTLPKRGPLLRLYACRDTTLQSRG